MKKNRELRLEVSDDDEEIVAYLILPGHPGRLSGAIKKTVSLRDLIGDYQGPDLFFDFDAGNTVVGIEILD